MVINSESAFNGGYFKVGQPGGRCYHHPALLLMSEPCRQR